MKKTKVNIISGFLGSGKTSFIKKIIEESEDFSKTAIIENEFGQISIDGPILKSCGIQVREINAGCICCSVAGNFTNSLLDIKKNYDPEQIIIEPSGIAKLSDLKSLCLENKDLFEMGKLITVVDLLRFNLYIRNFGEFYKDQIASSNTIVFSRYTKALDQGLDIQAIVETIKLLNPKLNVIDKEWNDFRVSSILTLNKIDLFSPVHSSLHTHCKDACQCHDSEHIEIPFESLTIKTNKEMDEKLLKSIFIEIESSKETGNVLRAKGSFRHENQSMDFDYNSGELNYSLSTNKDEHHVIVIGEKLNENMLTSMFI